MKVYKKDYTTNNQRRKLMLEWCGRAYVQDLIDIAIEDEEIIPDGSGFYATLNRNMETIWDYFWEDICNAQ